MPRSTSLTYDAPTGIGKATAHTDTFHGPILDIENANAWILEDDYCGEFRYDGRTLPALQGRDDGGTFNKTSFPSLRIGYVIVPAALADAFSKAEIAGHGPSLMTRPPFIYSSKPALLAA